MANRLRSYVESLRFPVLLLLAFCLLVADVLVPDALPFLDEALLLIGTALLARIRRKAADPR